MKHSEKRNSGFSLIELIIALAVLSFLMLAVSSFMGSSIMQTKKSKVDIRMQTQAQETYSLITDTLMQATSIVMTGYTADADLDFSKTEAETTATLTKRYFVKDDATRDDLVANPAKYGLNGSIAKSDIGLFSELSSTAADGTVTYKNVYVTELRIESSVPLDMTLTESSKAGGNSIQLTVQNLTNQITGEIVPVTGRELSDGSKVYDVNDTLVSTFYFEGENLYYGREYAFMTSLNDELDITDSASKRDHLYNKYFCYLVKSAATAGGVDTNVSGCVATVNADDGTIGIDLFYNQSSMEYTTLGRINTRNSYVLKPKK